MPEVSGVRPASMWFFIISNPGLPQGHVLGPFLYLSDLTSPSARTWQTPILSLSRTPSTFNVLLFFSDFLLFLSCLQISQKIEQLWSHTNVGSVGNTRWAELLWRKWSSSTAALAQEPKNSLNRACDKATPVELVYKYILKKGELIIKIIMATNECAALPPEFSTAVSACGVNLLRFVCFCLISRTFGRL